MRNKQFYRKDSFHPARSRYSRKLEPWEYRMPTWMFLGVASVSIWIGYKIALLIIG